MTRYQSVLLLIAMAVISTGESAAQGVPVTAVPPAVVAAPPPPVARAGWYSDRRPIRVGDLITVYINERTSSSERISTVANSNRSQDAGLDATFAPEALKSIGIGYGAKSNQTGTADRRGDFTAALTVRVTEIEANGAVRVSGKKNVRIDGRSQAIALGGVIRPDDIVGGNSVLSTRIAEAEITYQGKNISPKTGLFGKLLAALWP